MHQIGDDIINTVTIKEYLSDNCKYKGCKYNNSGCCDNDDEDFLGNIEEIVKDEGYNTDTIICDKPIIRKGHCPYCGVVS